MGRWMFTSSKGERIKITAAKKASLDQLQKKLGQVLAGCFTFERTVEIQKNKPTTIIEKLYIIEMEK